MPSYKLTYFDARGRAEVARFLFVQAGVPYEDIRIAFQDFGALKPSLLTGTLPLLEVDDKKLTGSGPINRYLAEELGFAGKDNFEKALIGGIVDVVDDLFSREVATVYADPLIKEKLEKRLHEEDVPKFLGILEKIISSNNSPEGWAFGNSVTYADMTIAVKVDEFFEKDPTLSGWYPSVKKCVDAVKGLPKIAQWIKERPDSEF